MAGMSHREVTFTFTCMHTSTEAVTVGRQEGGTAYSQPALPSIRSWWHAAECHGEVNRPALNTDAALRCSDWLETQKSARDPLRRA